MSGYLAGIDGLDPQWAQVLLEKGFDPSTVQMLKESPPSTFTPTMPRVGAIVCVNNLDSIICVKKMVLAHVSIYICWGKCNKNRNQFFKNFPPTVLSGCWVSQNCYPSDEDLKSATAVAFKLSVKPTKPSKPNLLPPECGSGQREGETWWQYFAHQAERNGSMETSETSIQCQAHLA